MFVVITCELTRRSVCGGRGQGLLGHVTRSRVLNSATNKMLQVFFSAHLEQSERVKRVCRATQHGSKNIIEILVYYINIIYTFTYVCPATVFNQEI